MAKKSTAQERDRNRYLRHRQGDTANEIASDEKVAVEEVQRSIQRVATRRDLHNLQELATDTIEVVTRLLKHDEAALIEGLTSKIYDERTKNMVADHQTRLQASKQFHEYLDFLSPKKGQIIQVGVNTGPQPPAPQVSVQSASVDGRSRMFEDRLRDIRNSKRLPAPETTELEPGAEPLEGEAAAPPEPEYVESAISPDAQSQS